MRLPPVRLKIRCTQLDEDPVEMREISKEGVKGGIWAKS
ncbi:uncharacterized protein G2W53_033218 [Senna tora]|uniref:Uncharacterized protein n=1 Tax=Senna tora TaxID=362788 RepID=A0A834W7R1_9FABA|nr:uncharacterized protein G2W53_033218 [Senna tora]